MLYPYEIAAIAVSLSIVLIGFCVLTALVFFRQYPDMNVYESHEISSNSKAPEIMTEEQNQNLEDHLELELPPMMLEIKHHEIMNKPISINEIEKMMVDPINNEPPLSSSVLMKPLAMKNEANVKGIDDISEVARMEVDQIHPV